jgi:excisionase family DNA binding protein
MEQLQFPELVDIETVANLLGVGERYVRRMVANREIEVVKVGHYVRFDLDVVRHWVETRRRPPSVSSRREIRPDAPTRAVTADS